MIVKKHTTPDGRTVLAVCDSEIINKVYENDKLQLDLTSDFYQGKEMEEENVKNLMKSCYILNLVGDKTINLALKLNLITKDCIVEIAGIKHAQVMIEQNN